MRLGWAGVNQAVKNGGEPPRLALHGARIRVAGAHQDLALEGCSLDQLLDRLEVERFITV